MVREDQQGWVYVNLRLRPETVAQVEELRASCAPGRVTAEQLFGMLIETGLVCARAAERPIEDR